MLFIIAVYPLQVNTELHFLHFHIFYLISFCFAGFVLTSIPPAMYNGINYIKSNFNY